ncbi:repressor of the inhibitor of the protein kinase [Chionoecetes opilio]|uniref:Repressor of the inhibitor of the protein kinase n=1 Tax=Chionoecetes opilio TaxID=41210 RepID=A0A8J4XZS0_CHIOP|nr:repressor of the inhibitor of the protein kinase [Chionoecetes opilio]
MKLRETQQLMVLILQSVECVDHQGNGNCLQKMQDFVVTDYIGKQSGSTHSDFSVKDSTRINFFYPILDHMLTEMTRRFNNEACELMKALQALNPQSKEFLSFEKMSGLIHAFRANEEDLNHELHSVKRMLERRYKDVSDNEKPKSLLDVVRILGPYEEAFPEFYRLAKIYVVLPVSSASAEGSFSDLKLIKTTLRNTMGNERFK